MQVGYWESTSNQESYSNERIYQQYLSVATNLPAIVAVAMSTTAALLKYEPYLN